ncbi:ABC transporter ATP-binding protein [Caldicellulosiruptoraceae bacterium PP1]
MIKVENLTKKYGQRYAINNVSFEVKEGEILGFLGPNGAGKSTTMNIITGYISPTDGSVTVDGFDILENPEEVKKRIGFLPELPPLYMDMTVQEYLDFVSDIKKVSPKEKKMSMEKIMDIVKIGDVRGRLIKNLSKGYKQRVGLAQALIGNPPVLILDEPTVGLDPKQIIEIRSVIKSLGKEHTIILSSHILPEVSAVCERVLIINKGKIVASDTPDNLAKRLIHGSKLQVRILGQRQKVTSLLEKIPGVKFVEFAGIKEENTLDFLIEAENDTDIRASIFYAMSDANLPILMMRSVDLSLEEIFLQLTTEEKEVS